MSRERARHEALRWLNTAKEDHKAAELLKSSGMFSHACFMAQQCAEKAVKALWFDLDEEPWGHSVQKLLGEVGAFGEHLRCERHLIVKAAKLDRFYIPARYPNGLPDLTPGTTFSAMDAEEALDCACEIFDFVSLRVQ